jgi:hypothetical protein
VRGVRALEFTVADAGGGVRRVYLEANGVPLRDDVRNCAIANGFVTALRPCPASSAVSTAVPTAGAPLATGPNVVDACAEDLALDGAPHRTCRRAPIWVDNVCPGSAVPATALSAEFEAGTTATVRSDRPAVLHGRVMGGSGPVAGTTVCALTRVRIPGAPIVVGALATSGPDGRYELELAPGPGREVFVHHAFGDRVIARHGLGVRSVVRPTLAVDPGRARAGDRLGFEGSLPGPACGDRLVKVQARIGKRRWQVFRTDRTDAGCGFAAHYRLRETRSAKRYRFRALVPEQAGYPYESGYSPSVTVRIERREGSKD